MEIAIFHPNALEKNTKWGYRKVRIWPPSPKPPSRLQANPICVHIFLKHERVCGQLAQTRQFPKMLNSILAARNDRAGEETTTQQPLQSNYPGVLHILRSGERSRASQNLPRAICAASNGSGGLRSPLALSGSGAVDGTRMHGEKNTIRTIRLVGNTTTMRSYLFPQSFIRPRALPFKFTF